MKKQINPTTKAHLIRGAFYLLLLMAVCAIPFALAQSRSRGTTNRSATGPAVAGNPDFAPPGFSKGEPSSVPARGAAALASGVVDASGAAVVNNLPAPVFPEGGCGTPGPWSTATPGPAARYRAGGCTDGQYVYVYGGGNSLAVYITTSGVGIRRRKPGRNSPTCRLASRTFKAPIGTARYTSPAASPRSHYRERHLRYLPPNMEHWRAFTSGQTGANVAFNNKIYNFGGNPGSAKHGHDLRHSYQHLV